MNIVTEYPVWFIIFCLLLGLAYSFILYRKDKSFYEVAKWKVAMLSVLRFISVTFLSFLLLNPFIKTVNQYFEKPVIVVVTDNSESVTIGQDSAWYREGFGNELVSLVEDLQQDYDVNDYIFGENLKEGSQLEFSEKYTDISMVFNEVSTRYANRNVGAVIIATDGIYNRGMNPYFAMGNDGFPIYTVALGDTTVRKDLIISEVVVNKLTFLGNTFPVKMRITGNEAMGATAWLKISKEGSLVVQRKIDFLSPRHIEELLFQIEADRPGLQHYKIEISKLDDELSYINNVSEFVIDVIDSKQKILILANSTHPDLGALKRTLTANPNYDVEITMANDFNGSLQDYNLVILHQLPSVTNSGTNIISQLIDNKIPALFIMGSQSAVDKISALNLGLSINSRTRQFDEAQASFNGNFSLFGLDQNVTEVFQKTPPLFCPFGDYKTSQTVDVLAYQKIGTVLTDKPLIAFNTVGEVKYGFICGEGLWRWRVFNYLEDNSPALFNDITNKVVQYLALSLSKQNFIVNHKKVFQENEPLIFDAEVYNQSYELVNNEEVSIEIVDNQDRKYPYLFSRTSNAYRLSAGTFPAGDYSFTAKTMVNGEPKIRKGAFSVLPSNLEADRTLADHQLLYKISDKSGGIMTGPKNMLQIAAHIRENSDIVTLSYSEKQLHELIHIKWIFAILVFILALEWFFRKYLGSF